MYQSPYNLLGVDPNMTPEQLEKELLEYKSRINEDYISYASSYKMLLRETAFKVTGTVVGNTFTDEILARRYILGMELDRTVLDRDEMELYFNGETYKKLTDKDHTSQGTRTEAIKRFELFATVNWKVSSLKGKIERALQSYRDNPEDSSKMMDVLLELKLDELKAKIANDLATRLSENGKLLSEEEFLDAFRKSINYRVATKAYEQIQTQDKRDDLIPELYLMKNMVNSDELKVIDEADKNRILDREAKYLKQFLDYLQLRYEDRDSLEEYRIPENQNHDYGWGVILEPKQYLFNNEPVNTPIFKGRLTVEGLGVFTEQSLYKKRKKFRERDKRVKVRSENKKGFDRLKRMLHPEEDASGYETRSIMECYYMHEAQKKYMDNILRVTKTDAQGRTTTSIIFSPVPYNVDRGSEMAEFLKNVYFSDPVLAIAQANGGYAGTVIQTEDGFYITNKFNHEEIASAVLFQNGEQKGNILDCRNRGRKVLYEGMKRSDFLKLVNQPTERTREFNE